ncbi:hypothetical protein TNCV_4502721 [Trichonephila clavipes]|nr:hypothetical protein TNCV_4502721 [Trichonephila clavipes]
MLVCSSAYEALLENVQFIPQPAQASTYLQGQLKVLLQMIEINFQPRNDPETYPSEIYIQAVSKANEEEQLPEGKERVVHS